MKNYIFKNNSNKKYLAHLEFFFIINEIKNIIMKQVRIISSNQQKLQKSK